MGTLLVKHALTGTQTIKALDPEQPKLTEEQAEVFKGLDEE